MKIQMVVKYFRYHRTPTDEIIYARKNTNMFLEREVVCCTHIFCPSSACPMTPTTLIPLAAHASQCHKIMILLYLFSYCSCVMERMNSGSFPVCLAATAPLHVCSICHQFSLVLSCYVLSSLFQEGRYSVQILWWSKQSIELILPLSHM